VGPNPAFPSDFNRIDPPEAGNPSLPRSTAARPAESKIRRSPESNKTFETPRQSSGFDNKAPPEGEFLSSGEKTKARDILDAIRTLKTLEQERRGASDSEKTALGKFSGFGPVALSIFPDPVSGKYKDDGWKALGEELKSLLTPAEYDSAKRTTFNAFYTSPTVIRSIHEALGQMGVPESATILEPGCGSGNFLALAKPNSHFIGIEMDSISGRVAKYRHPEHDIRVENFRDTRLPDDRIDAVVGNVPFADVKLEHKGQKYSLHDYFFAKSVDALKPGGIMGLVTSHYTLDKQNAAIREYLADQADFVGAIRLPSDAFKREGTAVVTDIVFLRKRGPGEPARHVDPDWLKTTTIPIGDRSVAVNAYFAHHPEMVLGDYSSKDTLYGGEGFSVKSNGNLDVQLKMAVAKLPKFEQIRTASELSKPVEKFVPPPQERHLEEGSFFIGDDKAIYQIQGGTGSHVVYGNKELKADGTVVGQRLAALVGPA